jgi:hypothetical protein
LAADYFCGSRRFGRFGGFCGARGSGPGKADARLIAIGELDTTMTLNRLSSASWCFDWRASSGGFVAQLA